MPKIAVPAVVAQEHLGRRQRRPFRDGVHADGLGLFVGEQGSVELVPGNILIHIPTDLL
jgi:hypothetical protein